MNIKKIQVGYLATNCYILEQDGNCLVVDPGDEFHKIEKQIGENKLLAVLITHSHEDHIGALRFLLQKYNVPVYDAYNTLEEKYKIGPFSFKVIYTPGHSSDSITFYFESQQTMFVGDFLFQNTIGRTDLETGNMEIMKQSIAKIKTYPNDIRCYPGHGESTTLGLEKENNIYFQVI